jgi:superfamily I DNA/RNA helicase
LQALDRFHLNDSQERYVALDHKGGYRIQGASGSGKTIILIHRALRLVHENPGAHVRVFTINRALADLLRSSVAAIHGQVPPNLHIAAFYDFLLECVCLFEPRDKHRLVDERSLERIVLSWRDFYHHRGQDALQNVFAVEEVRELLRSIAGRENANLDASRYLREEMVYIQSAYRKQDRNQYLSDYRRSRSIAFQPSQKEACLRVLHAWEEWLEFGDLCDIDGLTIRAAQHFEGPAHLIQILEVLPTDFVLVDEMQDFSTLELGLLRKLVKDPEGDNCIFLVGDPNQKVYAKHHDSRRAGFNFRGKAGKLSQNFRNTREILQAAYNLPQAFPPREDEEEGFEILSPELSLYSGGRPVVFECTQDNHLLRVLEIVKLRRGARIGIVSENDRLLADIRRDGSRLGFQCYELFRNEDLDLWREQGNSLSAALVLSRLEAVKGFEFDTVIACDLSQGTIPRVGTPEEEHWREAAVLYTALTRARDELITTFVGAPSRFLKAMLPDMDVHESIDENRLLQVLAIA